MARVRALLRRNEPEGVVEQQASHGLDLDRETRSVRHGSRRVQLAPLEFRLLESLLEKPGRIFSRAELRDRVWGQEIGVDGRTLDVYVGRLRKALSRSFAFDPIHTVRGSGYFFDQALATD